MKELYEALSKAQSEFPSIHKNKTVKIQGKYSYNYADLESIIKTIKPILAKHGLCFFQTIDEGRCVTVIAHKSGEQVSSCCPINYQSGDMQKIGSAITYAKRYSLSLAFGITTDDDLDANELQDEPREVQDRPLNAQKSPLSGALVVRSAEESMIFRNESPAVFSTTAEAPEVNLPPATFTPRKGPTEKQLKRLYAIGMSKSWSPMYVDAYVKATFATAAKDLGRTEYDKACDFLEKNPCNDVLKDQYKDFCVKRESAVDAMKKAMKRSSGYVDHTAEPPFPEGTWAPTVDDSEPLPF